MGLEMVAKRASVKKIAEACGVTMTTARRHLALSNLSHGRGGYPFAEACAFISEHADPARIAGHASLGRGDGGNAPATNSLAEARAMAERFRARKLELENAKTEGRLIDRETVTNTGVHIIATVRTAMLALGYRLAPKVANKSDLKDLARIVENEVRDVLGELADPEAFFAALEADALS